MKSKNIAIAVLTANSVWNLLTDSQKTGPTNSKDSAVKRDVVMPETSDIYFYSFTKDIGPYCSKAEYV